MEDQGLQAVEEGQEQPAERDETIVVAIGSSAGGIQALTSFFEAMPPGKEIAFIVCQHMAADKQSALPELLARVTNMTVVSAEADMNVEPGTVYVNPPGSAVTIKDGMIRLETREKRDHATASIDQLFFSVAEERRDSAICIVLSGAGSDGTLGLKGVKEFGGIAIAQEPQTAKFDSMPRSAITTGLVDHVLPVEQMPQYILQHVRYLRDLYAAHIEPRLAKDSEAFLEQVHAALRRATGHDFSHYKSPTVLRRIGRRMQVLQLPSVDDYVSRLNSDSREAGELMRDMLIGVTSFFRDPAAFEVLRTKVIAPMVRENGADRTVRIWSPGCSTGEEAFSHAILLHEEMAKVDSPPRVQIFATDISEEALGIARLGCYPQGIVAHVSPERLEQFFTPQGDRFQVKKKLREMVIFSSHSLIKHPPFSRMNLISCRNLLIYLNAELQQRIINLLHYALQPDGHLFLGPSESIGSNGELFRALDNRHRIYIRRETVSQRRVQVPLMEDFTPLQLAENKAGPKRQREMGLRKSIDRFILENYSSPTVVVDEERNIQHISGRTGKYLEMVSGAPTRNIMDLARKDIRMALRAALHRASQTKEAVVHENITVGTNGELQSLNLIVRPYKEPEGDPGLTLVIFQELGPSVASPRVEGDAANSTTDTNVQHLEQELRITRERLHAAVEELESSNEDLKSANEELQSMNEELQSSNEELQTSKEELQSINEELETVNDELNFKVDEVDHAHSDLQNLFDSTNIATVFLDNELRIKSFTPASQELFRMIGSDTGRHIGDIAANFMDGDLVAEVRHVLETAENKRELVRKPNGDQWYIMSVRPYRTLDHVIQGVVLTFSDVTELKRAEDALRSSEERLRLALRSARASTWSLELYTGNVQWSEEYRELFGLRPQDEWNTREDWLKRVHPSDIDRVRAKLSESAEEGALEFQTGYRYDHPTKGLRWMTTLGKVMHDNDKPPRMVGITLDVTDRAYTSEEQQHMEERFREAQKLESLGILAGGIAHDFNNLLLGILGNTSMLLEELDDEKLIEKVRDTETAARLAADLCQQMLAYSGKGKFVISVIDISKLFEEIAGLLRPSIQSNAKIELQLDAALPAVEGDRTQLRQVVLNLLTNALESIGEEGGTVKISTGTAIRKRRHLDHHIGGEKLPEGNYVFIEIADDGIGMPGEMLIRIFEPFFTTKFTGRGLGLSAVLGIVKGHHGCMDVSSQIGKGTTFRVYLPASDAPVIPADEDVRKLRKWKKGGRVLLVDDSETVRRTSSRMLERGGFEVTTAEDGLEAVEIIKSRPGEFDIVLLDLTMPRMDGNQAYKEIRRLDGKIPVLICSGYNQAEVVEHFEGSGLAGFIQKPYDCANLIYQVHLAIEGEEEA